MWLAPYFSSPLGQDLAATAITFGLCLAWLRLIDALAQRGLLEQRLSRKIIHIGTGPLFLLCWNLFSDSSWARFFAALVPLAITAQFALVGLGVIKDPPAVQAMTRHGDPREILRGPLFYGLVFVLCTVVFWRHSPVGIVALMLLCGGDGLADIAGRRWGRSKLPFNPGKSWAGSAAMFAGGFAFSLLFVVLFNLFGDFKPPLPLGRTAGAIAGIALAAAVVEALPLSELDNLTVTAVAIALGLWWL